MSDPEINEPSAAWHERITTPFRALFQEGFLATWHNHTLFSLVSLSLLALVLVSGVWWFGLREAPGPDDPIADKDSATQYDPITDKDPTTQSNPSDIAEQLQADEDDWARIQEQGQRQEEIAVARYRLLCVRQLGDRVKDAIDNCRDESAEWIEDMKDFKMAAIDWSEPSNRALLGRVDMLLSLDTPDKVAADELMDRHKVLVAPLQRAESSGESAPVSSSLESSIEELASTAREMKDLFIRRRAMLASIRNAATTSPEEDLPTFSVALDDYRAELAAEQQTRIDGQLAEARVESEAILLQVEQEAEAALAEARRKAAETMSRIEVERAEAEARRAEQLQEVADAEAQLAADREKLEREFEMDLPEIRHYLAAFITPDNSHPTKEMTIEKLPFPYSYLESRDALAETDKGLRELADIAGHKIGDRPRGPIPYLGNIGYWSGMSTSERQPVVTAQQLLRKYGLLMVEKKMLLP
jgi:hypothetical protein